MRVGDCRCLHDAITSIASWSFIFSTQDLNFFRRTTADGRGWVREKPVGWVGNGCMVHGTIPMYQRVFGYWVGMGCLRTSAALTGLVTLV